MRTLLSALLTGLVAGLVYIGFSVSRAEPVSSRDGAVDDLNAAACTGCHGPDGNSKNALSPTLAGQDPEYIVRQLKAFQNNARQNQVMKLIASNLSEKEMTALARYFSARTPESAGGNHYLMSEGQMIYQARCWGCHGTNAAGQDGYPRLAGQHPEYLARQLNQFKAATRVHPVMNRIVAELSGDDIDALAAYLGSLDPRKPESAEELLSIGR
jgi:cytochrome c553